MDFESYTERSRGFVQAAQGLALRSNHQRFTPEHLLKVLIDDKEGLAANLVRAAGGDPGRVAQANEAELAKLPQVAGAGAGQVYLAPEMARVFEQAETLAKKAGDSFVTARTPFARSGHGQGYRGGQGARRSRGHGTGVERRDRGPAQGPHGPERQCGGELRRPQEVCPRPDCRRPRRKARSGDRARRGDSPDHPGAVPTDQEQSRADRRAGRRQDGDRRGPGAPHRQGRRARRA